jgi:purine nucleosidase
VARRVILDVDTGTDDAGALLLAATSPGLELMAALASWGNTTREQAARNTLAVLAEAGRPEVEVYLGAEGPRGPTPTAEDASDLMGTDGLGGLGIADRVLGPGGRGAGAAPSSEPAAVALVRLARLHPGEITLVAVAPLSTVGAALALAPKLPSLLADVVVMGGAIVAGGNPYPPGAGGAASLPVARRGGGGRGVAGHLAVRLAGDRSRGGVAGA